MKVRIEYLKRRYDDYEKSRHRDDDNDDKYRDNNIDDGTFERSAALAKDNGETSDCTNYKRPVLQTDLNENVQLGERSLRLDVV